MSEDPTASLGTRRLVSTGLLLALAAMSLTTLVMAAGTDRLGYDFHAAYLDGAEALLRDGTPYSADNARPYLYPPLLAELLVPVTLVPDDVSSFLAFVGSLAAVLGTLALLDVRDIRCYAAVLLWAPVWSVLELANVTAIVILLAAVVWRYRDSTWWSAAALGAAMAFKLFLLPVVMWAVATRRTRTAGLALGIGVAAVLAPWAAIGFSDLSSYPIQFRAIQWESGYSLAAILSMLGIDPWLGLAVTAIVGGALLIATSSLGRRGDDAGAFTYAIVATLAVTPIVLLHYLALCRLRSYARASRPFGWCR